VLCCAVLFWADERIISLILCAHQKRLTFSSLGNIGHSLSVIFAFIFSFVNVVVLMIAFHILIVIVLFIAIVIVIVVVLILVFGSWFSVLCS
jgi:hypothetical protein